MVSHLFFYQLVLVALVWLCVMLQWAWPSDPATGCPTTPAPPGPRPKRHHEPPPFACRTQKPHCDACEPASAPHSEAPSTPPPRIVPTRGRRRQVDASTHFCPNPDCIYRGCVGWGNLRANGHPSGGCWRQWLCVACHRYFLETLGTLFHGKHASVELIVRVIACLAEGLGIRGTARVFEVDPNTVLQWLVEAAEQLQAFVRHVLHDVRVQQVQLDELFALLSAVKVGEVSGAEAIERLERSPQWVWVAMDPESKLLLAIDVGDRTLAMAQRVVHQVAQVLAPDCAPLFLTDGFREYLTALLTHYGQWVQLSRRQDKGPHPKPRWMPLPQLLYAQVVKTVRRRRLVRVTHRVVFGTVERVTQVLAACGWQINTAFVERLNLSMRQHVAAVGRRVSTLCKDKEGLRQPLTLYQTYYNFCLPHISLRQPLPPAAADEWDGLSQAVAAVHASDGRRSDRSRLDPARGAALPRATLATAPGTVTSECRR
jgi:IS1 family transposase